MSENRTEQSKRVEPTTTHGFDRAAPKRLHEMRPVSVGGVSETKLSALVVAPCEELAGVWEEEEE